MTELTFAALFVLCSAMFSYRVVAWFQAREAAIRERRASCTHSHAQRVHAYGDPRFPKLVCPDCGHQEDLPAPIYCQHCGGDINLNRTWRDR